MKLSAKATAALDQVTAKFKAGDLSAVRQIAWISRDPADDRPAYHWTWRNQLLAFMQTGELDCRGYRQWQRAGRQVQKGTHAAYIWACTNGGSRPADDADPEEIERFYPRFTTIPVFAVTDTDGDPIPVIDYTPDTASMPALLDVAAALNVSIEYAPTVDETNAYGWYQSSKHRIILGTSDPRTFFHELGHALHDHINRLRPSSKAHRETVAEFTSCVLSAIYTDDDRSGKAWQYISHYNDDPLQATLDALADVAGILEALEALKPPAMAA